MEKVQDVVAIVCDGGQRISGGLILLYLLLFCSFLYLFTYLAVFVVFFSIVFSPLLRYPRNDAIEDLEDLLRICLPVKDFRLRKKWREKDVVALCPVPLFL